MKQCSYSLYFQETKFSDLNFHALLNMLYFCMIYIELSLFYVNGCFIRLSQTHEAVVILYMVKEFSTFLMLIVSYCS